MSSLCVKYIWELDTVELSRQLLSGAFVSYFCNKRQISWPKVGGPSSRIARVWWQQKKGRKGRPEIRPEKPFTWQTANSFAYVFRYFPLQCCCCCRCCCPTVCRSVNARRASAEKQNLKKKWRTW